MTSSRVRVAAFFAGLAGFTIFFFSGYLTPMSALGTEIDVSDSQLSEATRHLRLRREFCM